MIQNRLHFKVSFPSIPEPLSDVWRTISSYLKSQKCLPDRFYVSQIAGHNESMRNGIDLKLSAEEAALLIEERRLDAFFLDTGHSNSSVCYSLINMKELGGQTNLYCRIEAKSKAPGDWTPLIEGIIQQWSCIGSWQWGSLYNSWQNSNSLKYYEKWFGKRPDALVTYIEKSVCSLSPDRELINVSLNPGRTKELLPGIFFMPAAEMWLGPYFWQYAKCTKEEAMAADFFVECRDTPHFLFLKCWPKPFTRPDGEQGRQQQRIWKLFFHEDCEWPPGSGTICDEPMYGPQELMP